MWRPNQLSIDLKMDELLNQSIRKSIRSSPYLKPWVNPEDMRRDVRSRLPSRNLNAYLMVAQVRRTVISYHRKMTGPYGWTVDFSKINHHPGDPVSIEEWIYFHESVDLLTAREKFVFKMIAYGGFNVESLATQTGISCVTIDCLVSNARSRLHEFVRKGR
jgi:DNA-directed RNA polymerase specialized sigma24 family protein